MSIFGTIATDVRNAVTDVEAHVRDFTDKHLPMLESIAATVEHLQNDPIVQALEQGAGLSDATRHLIADFITKLAAVESQLTGSGTGPVGIDAQPDPAPAPQQPAQAGAQA